MEVTSINDTVSFDGWLLVVGRPATFTQATGWGDILLSEGEKVERLGVIEGGRVLAEAQIVYRDLPFGWRYAFCAGGPVFSEAADFEAVYAALIKYIQAKKCLFFRIEPPQDILPNNTGYTLKKVKDVNPRATTIIDLSGSEADILSGMHAKARYNIRLAEKKGLEIRAEKNVYELLRLMKLTGERDGFRLHYKQHYAAVLASPLVRQLSAIHNGVVVATLVLVGFGDTLTYLYGASDHAFRALQAPGLLQWAAIREAKQGGYKWYDFFGIAPQTPGTVGSEEYGYDLNHQYAGVTRFKLSFGGLTRESVGTHDLILHPIQYRLYQALRTVRRIMKSVIASVV